MKLKIRSLILIFVCLVFTVTYVLFHNENTNVCEVDEFMLPTTKTCHKFLSCDNLNELTTSHVIGIGGVKLVHLTIWNDVHMALAQLNNQEYKSDFLHGLQMLLKFQNSPYIVKLYGFCLKKMVILTEYHLLQDAINITSKLHDLTNGHDNLLLRFKLCLNYAKILETLHDKGYVNCDSNNLNKLLSQILLTNELKLVLNDLDSLADLVNGTVKCGPRQIFGNFVAPEQLWPYSSVPFSNDLMPGYNEKTDIYKAASVCDYFIGDVPGSIIARYRLHEIHRRCKQKDPVLRPTAKELVDEYTSVIDTFFEHFELK